MIFFHRASFGAQRLVSNAPVEARAAFAWLGDY
jgi:hypothetical protein